MSSKQGAGASGPKQSQKSKGSSKQQLGLVNPKLGDKFGEWYKEVVVKSELISYYDISGCYILRPDAFEMWEKIQKWFDGQIKALGVRNSYFPLFIPESNLAKEKDHIEGFAAEVAWVTKSGKSDLANPIAIRPTSETVMYPTVADWIRSHRDLPLKLNQWTNVVRWEFKNPTPFIRSREFLWQEGHTAFATQAEAEEEVYQILELYRQVYEDMMAIPVVKGRKSASEKFAGALFTTSVEAFVPATGRGVQGATSHCLGQNFSKMFEIKYEDEDTNHQYVWQNSWGLTTRTIGVMIMVHGDNKGLVLPPRMACIQAVVIPIPNSKMEEGARQAMMEQAEVIYKDLKAAGIRVVKDFRENYTAGWKYNHWELKGVPIRIELGPKDMGKGACMVARRDTGVKQDVLWDDVPKTALDLMETIQHDMLAKAKKEFDSCIDVAYNWDDFKAALGKQHMVLAPWCDEEELEEKVKKDTAAVDLPGAKTLNIPFPESNDFVPELKADMKCFVTGKPAKNFALWGRSY